MAPGCKVLHAKGTPGARPAMARPRGVRQPMEWGWGHAVVHGGAKKEEEKAVRAESSGSTTGVLMGVAKLWGLLHAQGLSLIHI